MDKGIWLGILDSDRYYRYYLGLSDKYQRSARRSDLAMGVFATGVVGILVTHLFQGTNETLALSLVSAIIGGIASWQRSQGNAVKATAAAMISAQYKTLNGDWKRLARIGYDAESFAVLSERLTSIADQYNLPTDRKLNREAERSSDRVTSGEYLATN